MSSAPLPEPESDSKPRLVTIREAAAYCDRNQQTLRNWIAAGKLSVFLAPPRRAAYVDLSEIDRLLAERRRARQRKPRRATTRPYGQNARVVVLHRTTEAES